jgi:hypothetical protein
MATLSITVDDSLLPKAKDWAVSHGQPATNAGVRAAAAKLIRLDFEQFRTATEGALIS